MYILVLEFSHLNYVRVQGHLRVIGSEDGNVAYNTNYRYITPSLYS